MDVCESCKEKLGEDEYDTCDSCINMFKTSDEKSAQMLSIFLKQPNIQKKQERLKRKLLKNFNVNAKQNVVQELDNETLRNIIEKRTELPRAVEKIDNKTEVVRAIKSRIEQIRDENMKMPDLQDLGGGTFTPFNISNADFHSIQNRCKINKLCFHKCGLNNDCLTFSCFIQYR